MNDKTISQLPEKTSPIQEGDLIIVEEFQTGTKKMQAIDLLPSSSGLTLQNQGEDVAYSVSKINFIGSVSVVSNPPSRSGPPESGAIINISGGGGGIPVFTGTPSTSPADGSVAIDNTVGTERVCYRVNGAWMCVELTAA